MEDEFDLERFVSAQSGVLAQVLDELRAGEKRGHWIWFVFPQMKGLGRSPQAGFYGIGSLAEAQAYLHHPLLGPRLVACAGLVNAVKGRSIQQILDTPDNLKFRSSMTLFAQAGGEFPVFREALEKYFGGKPDPRTLELLSHPRN